MELVRNVNLFKWGKVKHPKGDFVVNREFADEMIKAFEHFKRDNYTPPVLIEHKSHGGLFGFVEKLFTQSDGIYANLKVHSEIKKLIEEGRFRNVSPSFLPKFQDPHSEKEFSNVLRELSLVSVPHLKNLNPIPTEQNSLALFDSAHYLETEVEFRQNSEIDEDSTDMDVNETPEKALEEMPEAPEETPEEDSGGFDAESAFGELKEMMMKILEAIAPTENEEDEEESSEDLSETVEELKQELAQKNAELEVQNSLPTADRQTIVDLAEVYVIEQTKANRLIESLKTVQKPVKTKEKGVVGSAGNGSKLETLAKRAVENGATDNVELFAFLEANNVDVLSLSAEEINSISLNEDR